MKSRYWRVRILTTQEEEVFSTRRDAMRWVEKWQHTFQQDVNFEITLITEKSVEMSIPYDR